MSNPSSASDHTSPGLLVRSSEASTVTEHGNTPAPTPEPEAIAPVEGATAYGSQPLSYSSNGIHLSQEQLQHQQNGKNSQRYWENSNTNTPRLPFAKDGDHGLLAEDTALLDPPNYQTHGQFLSSDHSRRISVISSESSDQTAIGRNITLKMNSLTDIPLSIEENYEDHAIDNANRDQSRTLKSPYNDHPLSDNLPLHSRHIRTWSKGEMSFLETRKDSDIPGPPDLKTRSSDPSQGATETLSKQKIRSSSRSSQSRVEKRIEATLAEAAPTTNARSRKSSHMLGLFKENTIPQEGRRHSQNTKSPPPMRKDGDGNVDGPALKQGTETTQNGYRAVIGLEEEASGNQPLDTVRGANGPRLLSHDKLRAQRSISEPSLHDNGIAEAHTGGSEKGDSLHDVISKASKRSDSTSRTRLPSRLLEEIREYHNVSTPFHDRFRTTQAKLTEQRTRVSDQQSTERSQQTEPNIAETSGPSSREAATEEQEGEEDDSDKEQISSALYYPHEAPSPDALKDVDINEARKQRDAEQGSSTALPDAAIDEGEVPETPSSDVDINFQSRNRSRHLHGDLQQARPSSGELDYNRLLDPSSSASESEPEFTGYSSLTDDAELTPRASPTTKASFLQIKGRKARPAAPLGAVELKPYNHQVGGHTTVFRFSKRAVCKQLTSRENRFYELVEKHHPELLKFLPRYASSLNIKLLRRQRNIILSLQTRYGCLIEPF